MADTGFHTSTHGHVLLLRIDRPKVNALDTPTSRALGQTFAEFENNDKLRCAVVTGTGRFFSAGWDLKAADAGETEGSDFGIGGFAGLTEFFSLTKPVIAAVNGIAIGGGFELALACDLILASDDARFALPETGLGVMADVGGVQRLPRRLPHHIAMELLLTGRSLLAEEAQRHGLVNEVLTSDALFDRALALATQISDGAPLAVRAIKQVVNGSLHMSIPETFVAMRSKAFPLYDRMLSSEDRVEGPRAFVEKRKPLFNGC